MKIYTKKGDHGFTSLFGGTALAKDDIRIRAYGEVDELNSVIGCVISELENKDLQNLLQKIQKELFMLGSELAMINPPEKLKAGFVQTKEIENLEKQIDSFEVELEPLTRFILPGGTKAASLLHLARTVCRRTERTAVSLSHREPLRPEVIMYLNRLSDFFFVMARVVNRRLKCDDILWEGILS